MKKKIVGIVIVTVIALLVGAFFVYSQITELQNQISELKAQNSDLLEQTSKMQEQNTELQNQTSELNEQLNELQNKTYKGLNVTIAAFKWIGGFNPYVGLAIEGDANVTVQNNEAYAISGFKLTLTLVHKSTGVVLSGIEAGVSIGTLHAFEIREITGHAYWHVGDDLGDADCRVVLSLGNFVVDEKTFSLS